MPITASLGSLSYTRVSLGNYDHWYMQTLNNVSFSSFTFDSAGAFYVLGLGSGLFQVTKFQEISKFPYKVATYDYTGSNPIPTGGTTTTTAIVPAAITYNSYSNNLMIAGSGSIRYFPTYPYNSVTAGISFQIGTDLSVYSNEQILDWGNEPTGYYRYHQALSVDSSNGDLYFAGFATSSETGGPYDFYIRKKIAIDSTDTNVATTVLNYPSGSYIANIVDVKLDASKNPVYCGIAQTTNTTGRRIVLRKASQNPVLYDGYYYLPTTWERQLTSTQTLQSAALGIDSSSNIYLVANDTGSNIGYIIKYDTSGAIQWQRAISNVKLLGINTDASGNSYIIGNNTSNNLFIAKYNSSGTIQWQNKLAGQTFTGNKIYNNGTDLYIMGNVSTNGFMFKVPNDGSIPGSGSYLISGATLTYSNATQTETAGTLTDAVETAQSNSQAPLINNINNNTTNGTLNNLVVGLV